MNFAGVDLTRHLEDSHDLVQQLATIWQQYVLKPVAEAASHWPTPDQPEQDLQTNWSEQLKQEIQQSGRLAVTDLLRSLDTLAPDRLDLEQFFLLWVRACDHAYVELIRSEAVSRAMGETVTNLFRAMATQPGSVQSAPTQAKQASREK